MTPVKKYNMET